MPVDATWGRSVGTSGLMYTIIPNIRTGKDMPTPHANPTNEELNRLFTEAYNAQSEEHFAEAAEKYLLLLDYFQAAMIRYNLGLVYFSLERFTDAVQEFSQALLFQPEDSDTLFNLALCQKKSGDSESAIATYIKLLEITPDNTDCCYNLAGCYRDTFADEQAISFYQKVLAIDAGYLPALNNLAYLYHRSGGIQEAELCYRRLLILRPDDESAHYMLASLLGTPLSQAPDVYVRNFFDSYSVGFEKSLIGGLGYDNPRQLHQCLANYVGEQKIRKTYEHGLDLGCGTGLGGIAFQDTVAIFHGVDLSAKMLSQAADKNCYAALYQDSISHYLQVTIETYDFFLATDVFIYVGALEDIFTTLHAIARPQALFCFSTEALESSGYRLQKTGRFAYSRNYIRETAAATGWEILSTETTRLRKREKIGSPATSGFFRQGQLYRSMTMKCVEENLRNGPNPSRTVHKVMTYPFSPDTSPNQHP